MKKIVLIGSPGSGKTVLLATLTGRYQVGTDGISLHPQGKAAWNFETENWSKLNRQEWPSPTPDITKKELLYWDIKCNNKTYRMLTVDHAGENWSKFVERNDKPNLNSIPDQFSKWTARQVDRFKKKEVDEVVPEQLLLDSVCVIILLDLIPFINGETDEVGQGLLIQAIYNYLKSLNKSSSNMAIVLTQTDRISAGIKERYNNDYREMLKSIIPYNAAIFDEVEIIPVAAVCDTEQKGARRVPAKNFRSMGLDVLLKWIIAKQRSNNIRQNITKFLIAFVMLCFVFCIYNACDPFGHTAKCQKVTLIAIAVDTEDYFFAPAIYLEFPDGTRTPGYQNKKTAYFTLEKTIDKNCIYKCWDGRRFLGGHLATVDIVSSFPELNVTYTDEKKVKDITKRRNSNIIIAKNNNVIVKITDKNITVSCIYRIEHK